MSGDALWNKAVKKERVAARAREVRCGVSHPEVGQRASAGAWSPWSGRCRFRGKAVKKERMVTCAREARCEASPPEVGSERARAHDCQRAGGAMRGFAF